MWCLVFIIKVWFDEVRPMLAELAFNVFVGCLFDFDFVNLYMRLIGLLFRFNLGVCLIDTWAFACLLVGVVFAYDFVLLVFSFIWLFCIGNGCLVVRSVWVFTFAVFFVVCGWFVNNFVDLCSGLWCCYFDCLLTRTLLGYFVLFIVCIV